MTTCPRVDKRHEVQSVSKALEVLCCFSVDKSEWGITELAAYLGICKSAAHRILITCERYQFVIRTDDHRYRLGPRALELGNTYRFDRRLLWKAEPILRRLADETGSIAHLGELDGREVRELTRSAGPGAILFTPRPQFRSLAHTSGMGKVLLAFGGEELIRSFIGPRTTLTRLTRQTIVKPEHLRTELQKVREQGYAISDQESVLSCRCVAVPVRLRTQAPVAALSISSTQEKLNDTTIPVLLDRLRFASRAIGLEMTE